MATDVQEGEVRSYERTFTEEEIRAFAELSGDTGQQHVEHDAEGRLMAHGLLTATLPTKIGGEMDYVARSMEFEFHRPVYAGDTVTCETRITDLDEQADRTLMSAAFVCENQHDQEVMTGRSDGMIPG